MRTSRIRISRDSIYVRTIKCADYKGAIRMTDIIQARSWRWHSNGAYTVWCLVNGVWAGKGSLERASRVSITRQSFVAGGIGVECITRGRCLIYSYIKCPLS